MKFLRFIVSPEWRKMRKLAKEFNYTLRLRMGKNCENAGGALKDDRVVYVWPMIISPERALHFLAWFANDR